MLSMIRSRVAVKLALSLAVTLCVVMTGLTAAYITVIDRLVAEQEARTELYRDLNQNLRSELFSLQARLVAIPGYLKTDPIPMLQAWARNNHDVVVNTYNGLAEIDERFERRRRRALQQPNRILVLTREEGAAIAYGLFKDGSFADAVEELVLPGTDADAVQAKVDAIVDGAATAGLPREAVVELSRSLVDDAMAAENIRTALVGRVDAISDKERAVAAAEQDARMLVVAVSIAAVLLAILLAWVVMRRMITNALARLSHAAAAIAESGDADIGYTDRTDEIGGLARAVAGFRETLLEINTLKAEQEAERAAREADLAERLQALSEALEQGMGARVAVVTESTTELAGIGGNLDGLAGTTLERASESTALAESSVRFVDEVTQVVTALRETAERMSGEAQTQRRLTGEVATEAEQVAALVQELAATAGQIGGVVSLIERIANQTRLLALNASIEASRAGVAGAGFAVVAGEVKKLSGETTDAIQRIAEQVAGFHDGIHTAAEAVSSIRGRVRSVDDGMLVAAGEIEEMSRETAGIAGSVAEVAANAHRLAAVSQGVDAAARETGSMSGQMAELTGRITAAVDDMRLHLRTIIGAAVRQPAADAGEPFAAEADPEEIDTGEIDTDDAPAAMPIYALAAE